MTIRLKFSPVEVDPISLEKVVKARISDISLNSLFLDPN